MRLGHFHMTDGPSLGLPKTLNELRVRVYEVVSMY